MTSIGVPNTVTVLINDTMPCSVWSWNGRTTAAPSEAEEGGLALRAAGYLCNSFNRLISSASAVSSIWRRSRANRCFIGVGGRYLGR